MDEIILKFVSICTRFGPTCVRVLDIAFPLKTKKTILIESSEFAVKSKIYVEMSTNQ
jgi:hypothetical protein